MAGQCPHIQPTKRLINKQSQLKTESLQNKTNLPTQLYKLAGYKSKLAQLCVMRMARTLCHRSHNLNLPSFLHFSLSQVEVVIRQFDVWMLLRWWQLFKWSDRPGFGWFALLPTCDAITSSPNPTAPPTASAAAQVCFCSSTVLLSAYCCCNIALQSRLWFTNLHSRNWLQQALVDW